MKAALRLVSFTVTYCAWVSLFMDRSRYLSDSRKSRRDERGHSSAHWVRLKLEIGSSLLKKVFNQPIRSISRSKPFLAGVYFVLQAFYGYLKRRFINRFESYGPFIIKSAPIVAKGFVDLSEVCACEILTLTFSFQLGTDVMVEIHGGKMFTWGHNSGVSVISPVSCNQLDVSLYTTNQGLDSIIKDWLGLAVTLMG